MTTDLKRRLRLAIIAELASRLEDKLGRTALMKLIFFLQTRKEIDLGYSFRLYNYGPYDAQVIGDLRLAESLGGVASKEFSWSGGTGYTLALGQNGSTLIKDAGPELETIRPSIEWVVSEFGRRSAADLEIASTIVFVDDTNSSEGRRQCPNELVATVHQIKPHHSESRIAAELDDLIKRQLIHSVA